MSSRPVRQKSSELVEEMYEQAQKEHRAVDGGHDEEARWWWNGYLEAYEEVVTALKEMGR